jgi:purine-nucleoside/S-methyl-5'-thioadenosine phosphorylase / adenosine deaminase
MTTLNEKPIDGPIPHAEVPGWRENYGVVAGVTRKPFDLGLWTKEPADGVMTRWREFRQSETGFKQYILGHQVHGARVELHVGAQAARGRRSGGHRAGGRRATDRETWVDAGGEWRVFEGVDGHVTGSAGTMLSVTVADCTPVYLLHPATRTVALLHAGWRGTAAGILERGVQSLLVAAQGIPEEGAAASVVCHLGVSICGPCYEVGPEVFEAMGRFASGQKPETPGAKGHLDVRKVLAEQAAELGIGTVTMSGHCSKHGEGWYSARNGEGGRMVGYLGVPQSG